MKKRMISSLLAAAMVTALIGGCGPKQEESVKTDPVATKAAITEDATDAKEGDAAGDAEVELSFWYPISQESEAN